jgi:hypothetical protein
MLAVKREPSGSGVTMPGFVRRWLQRHRSPASFWLHMFGIPMTIAAVVLALIQLSQDRWDLWWRPVVLLAVGYLLQWIGHRIEGNDMGEVILIKRILGRPFVAVSPRYEARGEQEGRAQRRL